MASPDGGGPVAPCCQPCPLLCPQMLSCLEHMYHDLGLVRDFGINPITLKRWLVSGRPPVPYEHTFTRLHKSDHLGAFQMTRGIHGGSARIFSLSLCPHHTHPDIPAVVSQSMRRTREGQMKRVPKRQCV